MAKKKLKVGIIGVGGISGMHYRGYDKCEDAELWAICDIKPDVLKAKSERYGVPAERCFLDHRELLKLKEVDAVSVCTPNKSHHEITVNALKAGKHVLCEKPIAMNAREGKRMVDYVKGLVDDGTLGDIYYARCRAVRRRGVPSWGVFGRLDENGGGALLDIGVHMIDLTWYVMGKPHPVSVTGQNYHTIGNTPGHWGMFGQWDHETYTVEDFTSGYVRFANGATMSLECSFVANLDADNENFHVVGTKGGAGIGPLNVQLEVGGHICDATPHDLIIVDLHGKPAKLATHELEVMHFVDCVLHKKPTRVPGHEILWIQKIIDGLYKSAKTGKEVAIK